MPNKPKEKFENGDKFLKKKFWECLKRNQFYIQEYNLIKKSENLKTKEGRIRNQVQQLEISEKYSIIEPIDPSLDFCDEISKKIMIGGCYYRFGKSSLLWDASPASLNTYGKDFSEFQNGACLESEIPKTRPGTWSETLINNRLLSIIIDLNQPIEQIHEKLKNAASLALAHLEKDVELFTCKNTTLENFERSIRVYDLCKAGYKHSQIGKMIWPKDIALADVQQKSKNHLSSIKKLISAVECKPIKPKKI